jgi:Protein of unknown function (DUF2569)
MQNNPYQPPQANVESNDVTPKVDGPVGIGGWLILVVIGLVVTPIRLTYLLMTTYVPIFRDGSWSQLTTPGMPAYHALWAPVLSFEIVGNMLILVLALVTLFCLIRKSRKTPKMAIALYGWAAVFVVIDSFVGNLIPAVAAQSDPASVKELMRSLIGAAIWIPYFLVSKRVKATFVN